MDLQTKQRYLHLKLDGVFVLEEMCSKAMQGALAGMQAEQSLPPQQATKSSPAVRTPLSPIADRNGVQC